MIHSFAGLFLGGAGGAILHFILNLHAYINTTTEKPTKRIFFQSELLLLTAAFLFIVLAATGISEIADIEYFNKCSFIVFSCMGYLSRQVIDKVAQKGLKTLESI